MIGRKTILTFIRAYYITINIIIKTNDKKTL